ncbi:coiled-coil domain-containing protein 42-like, partial [Antrostomus carolinensis]|uniref:coiled-coil domain-containing protein 42-like n=1 Tax=Antrostomus carolinensis TaxID=279965 RepID=UPI0010A993C4
MATVGDEDDFLMKNRQNFLPLLSVSPRGELSVTEVDFSSPSVHLEEKRREAQVMPKALEEEGEAFRKRMEVIAGRWRDLHAKEAQLKAHKEKSLRMIKEREEMQVQALKKAIKEREMTMQKESDLLRAKRELEDLTIKRQELSNKVQKYSIFKKYLDDVVKISELLLLQSPEGHEEVAGQVKMPLEQGTAGRGAGILQHEEELEQLQLPSDQAGSDVRSW